MTLTNKQIDELIGIFKANQFLKSKTDKDDFLDNLKRDGFWVHDNVEKILTALEMAKANQWQAIDSAPEAIAVLTYEFDKDIGDIAEISTYAFDCVWECKGYKRGQYNPTHWIPLPTPPKKDEG